MIPLGPIRVGPVAPIAPGVLSAIGKHPVDRPLWLGTEGFAGDAQADPRHGGPEKAVHHYDAGHYPSWRADLGDLPQLAPGGFGENLSSLGLTESGVAVGDRFRLGAALVEVSQARQPCWKLNIRFGIPDMARRVQDSARTGWYYRVIEPGMVAPGDGLVLAERRAPDWTLDRLWRVLYRDRLDRAELTAMAELAVLSNGWRALARRRLDNMAVEDWTARLKGQRDGR
ncbi:MOSC domain-containing protein [Paracoccus sp. (in: a-proteobacteria)]|uniref:MOSC domain-containing protein n=1 Tax=Paracoccus sp. TaxID=267 RepID=UPI0026E03D03|nr:MOSC domain-containing protein [Paracoccus sp. (in: a-proteobacteria)]MDO5370298.1 MOSC domain-containing protein [Paracoccus sp. (in: a-proteobacteria)]